MSRGGEGIGLDLPWHRFLPSCRNKQQGHAKNHVQGLTLNAECAGINPVGEAFNCGSD